MIIELDAKLIVDLLSKANDPSSSNDSILADCKEELKLIPKVKIQHSYREANKCTDTLSLRGALLNDDFVLFLNPSFEVLLLVNLDNSGVTYDRL